MSAIRWLILIVAQIVALLFIALCTFVGGEIGELILVTARRQSGLPLALTAQEAKIFGAVTGFLVSAFLTATFFVLVEIAANTKRIAALLGRDDRAFR